METHGVSLFRALSVDLNFENASKDPMTKLVDCLVLLPNLRTLEVFSAICARTVERVPWWQEPCSRTIERGLWKEYAQFPSIRELRISDMTVMFIGSCRNVESIIVTDGLTRDSARALCSYRKKLGKLKRVVGIYGCYVHQGELRDTFLLETLLMVHYGSCTGLPGPPGDWHQE